MTNEKILKLFQLKKRNHRRKYAFIEEKTQTQKMDEYVREYKTVLTQRKITITFQCIT